MTVDLRFSGAFGPQPGGAVALVFGAGSGPPPDPVPLAGAIRTAVSARWRSGARIAPARASAGWGPAQHLSSALGLPWGAGAPVRPVAMVLPWASMAPARGKPVQLLWGAAQGLRGSAMQLPWGQALLTRGQPVRAPWRVGAPVSTSVQAGASAALGAHALVLAPWSAAARVVRPVLVSAAAAAAGRLATRVPWRAGTAVESIGGPWTPAPVTPLAPEPCWQPEPGGAVGLLFTEAMPSGLAELVFACRRAALAVVPVRRVYMVTNVTSLRRVADDADIPCLSFSLSLDVDSWAWGFSASVPASALPLLEPGVDGDPVELAAWVNGLEFRVIAESLARERTFGQASVRVQGRGATAALDAPYHPTTVFSASSALTSQQLADQAMPYGWTVDWGLEAWLVPGGIWSHQGTPATAIGAIAAAGGGYLLPHRSLQQVSVLPRYPVAPWAWAGVTPDLQLPAAVTQREAIEWVSLPAYNGVYVSGTTAGGVLRLVKRAGTAGDVLAPMITDPLITADAAARQRGLPVLANTGRVARVALRLPVLPETGVIEPGKFVRYVDGATVRLGLSRSVNVDVQGGQVWQSIMVETRA